MTEGDFFSVSSLDVPDGGSFTVDPSGSDTGAAEIHTVAGTGSAVIFKEVDVDDDGDYEISVEVESIDSPSYSWHSQNNKIELSQSAGHRLRVVNNDGGNRSFHACGIEITD